MCGFDVGQPGDRPDFSDLKSSLCPFTIRQLNKDTWLIREDDGYGEFPHIYARFCKGIDSRGNLATVIVLNDTGVGTTRKNTDSSFGPTIWTIRSFIEHTINPKGDNPYLVILSHCHWDHILGLKHMVPSKNQLVDGSAACGAEATVLASSHDPSFLAPWERLNYHSLCKVNKMPAPKYDIEFSAKDYSTVTYKHRLGVDIKLNMTMIHTPGHTPDSLTWYDIEHRHIYVGDSLYQQETDETRNAPWGREDVGPIMFTLEGDLFDWWESVEKLMSFVQQKNAEPELPRVKLASGHVTAEADALDCLNGAKAFMARVLRGDVPCKLMAEARGESMGHWTDDTEGSLPNQFSVGAPIKVVEKGRDTIPREKWAFA